MSEKFAMLKEIGKLKNEINRWTVILNWTRKGKVGMGKSKKRRRKKDGECEVEVDLPVHTIVFNTKC